MIIEGNHHKIKFVFPYEFIYELEDYLTELYTACGVYPSTYYQYEIIRNVEQHNEIFALYNPIKEESIYKLHNDLIEEDIINMLSHEIIHATIYQIESLKACARFDDIYTEFKIK